MTALKVGGEVDSMCTRCKMVLGHTILAMVGGRPVRVQCNTCGGQHNFRAPDLDQPKAERSRPATERTTTTSRARVSFDDVMAGKSGVARVYSPKHRFIVDEVVEHPTFGRGFVTAVRADKVDVTFRAGVKTLVHGRG